MLVEFNTMMVARLHILVLFALTLAVLTTKAIAFEKTYVVDKVFIEPRCSPLDDACITPSELAGVDFLLPHKASGSFFIHRNSIAKKPRIGLGARIMWPELVNLNLHANLNRAVSEEVNGSRLVAPAGIDYRYGESDSYLSYGFGLGYDYSNNLDIRLDFERVRSKRLDENSVGILLFINL